jgi:hypothetical protein
MKLSELLKFLNGLPERFHNYDVVNGEVGFIPKENETDEGEDQSVYRVDKPIVTLYVDEKTNEVCFFHQTDKEVTDIAGETYFDGGEPENIKSEEDDDGMSEEDGK